MQETTVAVRKQRKVLEKGIDMLWHLHDEAISLGDTTAAESYKFRAFLLLGDLPENAVYLQTPQ